MKYDIPSALQKLKPGAQWVLRGGDYSGLEWLDSSHTKPTETEVTNKLAELDAAEPMRFCLLYTSPSPRDPTKSRMPSSA